MSVSKNLLRARFLDKIERREGSDCWWWVGAKAGSRDPRGVMNVDGRMKQATHVAWYLENDEWPAQINHGECDNGLCVNVAHLWAGTQTDNMRDCVEKGRDRRRKLDEEKVREIKTRIARGESQYRIATDYGVTQSCINFIARGVAWRHVK